MNKSADPAREFWRDMLAAGGRTAVPRWTGTPAPGVAQYEEAIADDLVAALHRLTEGCAIPLDAVLLAAHAKVLAALTGEQDVTTGYVLAPDGPVLPCRLTTSPESWRALLLDAHRVACGLRSYQAFPIDAMLSELGLDQPLFDSTFSPSGAGEPTEGTLLSVGFTRRDGCLAVRLRYRTQAVDADYAARIAGYHQTALALMAADVDASHGQQSLLSADELRFQLEQLAGPVRALPDRRFHELFEERVRAHPDTVAVVRGERRWTYRRLNQRANVLARALLARGLGHEGVVAVATERTLEWAAATLAVLKAGGVYLPIEPHFPGERIAAMLSRAQCELVVTEPGSTTTLDEALKSLPRVRTLLVDAALQEGHPDTDLGVHVAADQLAYIFFTSGSTGEPKGAMCEHAGMLNHLYAKIADLGVCQGQVVAQTAPQCFDISLWQLTAALLVGGQTLLVEQEAILDVDRFVDTIAEGRVGVLQVVPSYLEAVLCHLERHQRELPALRCVSVTGEALKMELVHRWFANQPTVRLVNAYGLTETSDDTNHEVMDHAPDGDRVPLGRCVPNVRVYVVDDNLSPVPLGAPGAIVFCGVCVGRGYVNDPERTRQAFTTDPHRDGERLYRGGDFGRWLPGGKLEFLGRRDYQVKIRGFRIEIGDIENALLRMPGVRDCAVVVTERADHSKHLVAFYHAPRPLESEALREQLAATLPAYMVPAALHWREQLPLTANGKIDTKALTALAAELDTGDGAYDAPRTPAEKRIAAAWAKVLGVPGNRISRQDHFFDRGGTSLSAVKLAIALDRAVSLKDITRHPVLADLADLVDGRGERQSRLLRTLSAPDGPPTGNLVCFPHEGGNAADFQAMAAALHGTGLAVHAVEPPGHDPAAEHERFAPLERLAEQTADEITRRGLTGILLWGQSAGTALAVETARLLQASGVHVQRLFLAAQLLGDVAGRRAAIVRLTGMSDAEIANELREYGSYRAPGDLHPPHPEHTCAAYRHDCLSANRYFADALAAPPTVKLTAPVTVVATADDPSTAKFAHRHRDWQLLAHHVDLYELPDGGHHFPRTRPAAAARAVVRAFDLSVRATR